MKELLYEKITDLAFTHNIPLQKLEINEKSKHGLYAPNDPRFRFREIKLINYEPFVAIRNLYILYSTL